MRKRKGGGATPLEPVAGNGLLHRRALLRGGAMFAGALGTGASLNRRRGRTAHRARMEHRIRAK